MGPRNGVPAAHSAPQTRVNALLLSRGAPRGDVPRRTGWVRFAKTTVGFVSPKCAALPRPHAEEHRSTMSAGASTARMRCDASRSMRAMPWPSSSFGTRARPSEFAAGLPHARSSRRGRASRTKELTIQTAHLVPAAHFCVRGLHPCFTHPERGVGGAPRNVRVLGGTPVGRIMTRYARRLRGALRPMTRDARLSALRPPLDSGERSKVAKPGRGKRAVGTRWAV